MSLININFKFLTVIKITSSKRHKMPHYFCLFWHQPRKNIRRDNGKNWKRRCTGCKTSSRFSDDSLKVDKAPFLGRLACQLMKLNI